MLRRGKKRSLFWESHKKQKSILKQKVEFLNVKSEGTGSNHRALMG
jgi:hypothetical protein